MAFPGHTVADGIRTFVVPGSRAVKDQAEAEGLHTVFIDAGFDAVIAPSFSDIFRNNCTKNGLVPVVVPDAVVTRIWETIEADPDVEITVDMERRIVEIPAIGLSEPFPIDDATQHRFLNGLDDIGITLTHADDIAGFEADRPSWLQAST